MVNAELSHRDHTTFGKAVLLPLPAGAVVQPSGPRHLPG